MSLNNPSQSNRNPGSGTLPPTNVHLRGNSVLLPPHPADTASLFSDRPHLPHRPIQPGYYPTRLPEQSVSRMDWLSSRTEPTHIIAPPPENNRVRRGSLSRSHATAQDTHRESESSRLHRILEDASSLVERVSGRSRGDPTGFNPTQARSQLSYLDSRTLNRSRASLAIPDETVSEDEEMDLTMEGSDEVEIDSMQPIRPPTRSSSRPLSSRGSIQDLITSQGTMPRETTTLGDQRRRSDHAQQRNPHSVRQSRQQQQPLPQPPLQMLFRQAPIQTPLPAPPRPRLTTATMVHSTQSIVHQPPTYYNPPGHATPLDQQLSTSSLSSLSSGYIRNNQEHSRNAPLQQTRQEIIIDSNANAHQIQRPAFLTQPVYQLACAACIRPLCLRAMKAVMLSDHSKELYSTDMPPAGLQLVNEDRQVRHCGCRIRDSACLGCGQVAGYHVTQPCSECLRDQNNGHFWMFYSSAVHHYKRSPSNGLGDVMLWADVPPISYDQTLTRQLRTEVPILSIRTALARSASGTTIHATEDDRPLTACVEMEEWLRTPITEIVCR